MKALLLNLLLIPLGCFGGGGPTPPPPAQSPVEQADASVTTARDNDRRRRRAAASQTILTSPYGATGDATTMGKSLLGA